MKSPSLCSLKEQAGQMGVDRQLYLTETEVRALYTGADRAHDFDHVLRVARMAVHLACAEGADQTVVRLAALLHDAPAAGQAQPIETEAPTLSGPRRSLPGAHRNSHIPARSAHHLAAADFARQLLAARGLGNEQLANVIHCIEAHRFRDQSIHPVTLEARCLYDADKLDSIGAIGVARVFAYAGRHNNRLWTTPWMETPSQAQKPAGADYTPVHEFVYKLRHLSDTLYTATARRIGEQRHAFLYAFFDQLDAEMQGVS
jgi:uncharacterized protein